MLAGGCYLPLDPNYPRERIGFMLDDTKARLVITRRGFERSSPAAPTPLRSSGSTSRRSPTSLEPRSCRRAERSLPEALAYLIYTSGSTGRPKGVAIAPPQRRRLLRLGRHGTYGAEEMSGVFAGTSVCFDISIFEIFYTLACGGTVILGRDALHLPSHPARDRVHPDQHRAVGDHRAGAPQGHPGRT